VREEGVLLRAVEAVDFVNEQQSALRHAAKVTARRLTGFGKRFFQISDAGKHGGDRDEAQTDSIRQQPRDARFTRAGRPP
jgi:hypothetical protein